MNLKSTLCIFSISVSLLLSSCSNNPSGSKQNNDEKTQPTSTTTLLKNQVTSNLKNKDNKKKFVPTSGIVLVAKELFKNGRLNDASQAYQKLIDSSNLLPLSLENEMLTTFLYTGNAVAAHKMAVVILKKSPHSLLANLTIISLLNLNHGLSSKKSLENSCKIANALKNTPQKTQKGMFHSPYQLQDYMYQNTINYIHGWCLYEQQGKDQALKYFTGLTQYGALLSNAYIYKGLIHTLDGHPELAESTFVQSRDPQLLRTLQADLWQLRFAYVMGDQKTVDKILKKPVHQQTTKYYNNWRYSSFITDKSYLTKGMAFSKKQKKVAFSDLVFMVYMHQATLLKEIKFNFGSNILLAQATWLANEHYCLPKLMFADNLETGKGFYTLQKNLLASVEKESYCYKTSRTKAIVSSVANHKYNDGKLIIDQMVKEEKNTPKRTTKEIEGTIYKNLKNHDKTIAIFKYLLEDKALQKSQPANKVASSYYAFTIGTLYGMKKDTDNAIKYMKIAIDFNPTSSEAYNFLGYTLIDSEKDVQGGIKYVQKALKILPSSVYYMDSLAWGYYKIGNYQKAIKLLEVARITDPNQPEILNHLGDSYYQIGHHDKARMYWKRSKLGLASLPAEEKALLTVDLKSINDKIANGLK